MQYQNSSYRELSSYSVITTEGYRVRTSEFLKKSWNLSSTSFQTWKKSGKGDKDFFQSYNKCYMSEIFFWFWWNLIQSRPSGACSSVFWDDHLSDNLECRKRSYCFGKKVWKKVLNFASKLYEPWITLKRITQYITSPYGLYAFASVSDSRLVYLCKGFRRAL